MSTELIWLLYSGSEVLRSFSKRYINIALQSEQSVRPITELGPELSWCTQHSPKYTDKMYRSKHIGIPIRENTYIPMKQCVVNM